MAKTRLFLTGGHFFVKEALSEWSGEVPAVPDALVPNPRFGPRLPTSKERHSFEVFPATYGKSDNGIAFAVPELVPPKTHLIRNGCIQHRRNKQFHWRRFVCCCCCCFPQQALSDPKIHENLTFRTLQDTFLDFGRFFVRNLSVSGPFS